MTRSERFVVACAAVLGLAASVLNPMGEAPDEPDNVAVVERIRHEKRLVVPDDLLRQGMHPPFAFVVQALATVPLEAVAPILPEAITLPGPLRVTVPLDVSSGPPRESTGPADGSRASAAPHIRSSTWLGLRWLSVIVSTVGVALALRAARTLVPECPHAVAGATGLLLLAPQVVLQSAAVAMDPFILLFAAWAALELARGLRPGEPYSTVRAGAALAGAALVRHVGVPLLAVAALVALLRARRGLGARRATVELAIVFAIALAPFLAWMARNWAVAGDPLLVSAIYEKHPAMFRHASGLSFHEVDLWVGDMARTFYAPESAKVHLPATASLAFLLVVGAALLGALATLGRDVGARAVPPRSVVAFGAVALAVTVVLPLAGNTQLFQAGGRYAIPAVPFVVAAAAAG
ncbi:MAG TPA: glycosyltransferase family 39 protein, partial [Planctomycetota bacterium]|nr:glycosyltransferase family 39 protein [Planctomycetota bacterium]